MFVIIFFEVFRQVDVFLQIWGGGVVLWGPIVVLSGGGGCCKACGCAWLHCRGLLVVIFLCVCDLGGCFSDSQRPFGPFGYHKIHHKTRVYDRDLCGRTICFESLVVGGGGGGGLFGWRVHR